ncbi:MAG TPA: multicopper oxidase domain-containing protein [Gemmatimonadaceae bacterium]|nr:multicopper oxidase domain-containing protein [Gemmatimonadaceae bacterium]
MRFRSGLLLVSVVASLGAAFPRATLDAPASVPDVARAIANTNQRPAGSLHDGKLELKLEIVNARWFPEAEDGPSAVVPALAEVGRAPEIPGPMIRIPEGTTVHVTVRNTLANSEIFLNGLHTRPAVAGDVLRLAPNETKQVTFLAGVPGTYYYWASKGLQLMNERMLDDAMLSGAIIVDPKSGAKKDERIFLIGVWRTDRDSVGHSRANPRELAVINGKSWPYTERFTFNQGDTVSWRWINSSSAPHPMHLHGFYYDITRHGNQLADTVTSPADINRVNTHMLIPGQTMSLRFVPERPGNWLMHCHLALHVDGTSNLRNLVERRSLSEMEMDGHAHHGLMEMAGLILGMHVLPRGPQPPASAAEPQRLRLLIQNSPHGMAGRPSYGFVLQRGAEPARDSVMLPGPTLFLEKGRPARITLVNHLKGETAVHWHGMEIESYPDGVPGWSGMPGRLMPAIQPNDSFVAAFTPPRAGTFIYHSHVQELTQTNSGMYGALIVTDPEHRFDPAIDKIILIGAGRKGTVEQRAEGLVNGRLAPVLELEAGTTYRLRVVMIHMQANVTVRLGTDTTTFQWTPVAKDGADLTAEQSKPQTAIVLMGAGETGDFLYTPQRAGLQRIDVKTRGAGWWVPVQLIVRPARKLATLAK